jgi:two-component system NarL family sensor kinase
LPSALQSYIDGFAERSKISVTSDLTSNLGRLPEVYELCLFRIAQECLTNVHRHSGSSTAKVRLARMNGQIELEVTDEGRGLNQEIQAKIAGTRKIQSPCQVTIRSPAMGFKETFPNFGTAKVTE